MCLPPGPVLFVAWPKNAPFLHSVTSQATGGRVHGGERGSGKKTGARGMGAAEHGASCLAQSPA